MVLRSVAGISCGPRLLPWNTIWQRRPKWRGIGWFGYVCKGCGGALKLLSEHVPFTLTMNQQLYVVGKHLDTWESTCLSICTVIWYCSTKWLRRSPGMLVQPACTLPASSAGTWADQPSVLLFFVFLRLWFKCRQGLYVWMPALDFCESKSSYLVLSPSWRVPEGQQQCTKFHASCTGSGFEEYVFPAYPPMQVRLWVFFLWCESYFKVKKSFLYRCFQLLLK